MNSLLSYCGLVDAKIRASDKDLPVVGKEQEVTCLRVGSPRALEQTKLVQFQIQRLISLVHKWNWMLPKSHFFNLPNVDIG